MKIIKPSAEIEKIDGKKLIQNIERYGRTCYKSEKKITLESAIPFVKHAIAMGHFSIIEHEKVTATVVCDRGVSHEIVRHRIGSYSQESTRYINYKNRGLRFIEPCFWSNTSPAKMAIWERAMGEAEKRYEALIGLLCRPEEARSILPNSLATEIVITYNLREWRHFFYMRGARGAHPQIREVAVMLLKKMKESIPAIFDDMIIDEQDKTILCKTMPAS